MPRYWDEDDGKWIDCEVIWDGSGPLPSELHSRLAWEQKEAPHTLKKGMTAGQWVNRNDIRGKALPKQPYTNFIISERSIPDGRPHYQRQQRVYGNCRNCGKAYPVGQLSAVRRYCQFCAKAKTWGDRGADRWTWCSRCQKPLNRSQIIHSKKQCSKGFGCRKQPKEAAA